MFHHTLDHGPSVPARRGAGGERWSLWLRGQLLRRGQQQVGIPVLYGGKEVNPTPEGIWRAHRWRDVSAALRDLGRAGIWAQRAAEFDPSPPSLRTHRALVHSSGPAL